MYLAIFSGINWCPGKPFKVSKTILGCHKGLQIFKLQWIKIRFSKFGRKFIGVK